jgi:hypothetical protein
MALLPFPVIDEIEADVPGFGAVPAGAGVAIEEGELGNIGDDQIGVPGVICSASIRCPTHVTEEAVSPIMMQRFRRLHFTLEPFPPSEILLCDRKRGALN